MNYIPVTTRIITTYINTQ